MKTLYLCGAGNPEGVRLALTVNRAEERWDRLVILDDDPEKQGKVILGVEVAGPLTMLEHAIASDEVVNLVARTTSGRLAVRRRLEDSGLQIVTLIDPGVNTEGMAFEDDITVYQSATLCADSFVDQGSVAFGGSMVGHGSRIGKGCVIAPGAVINARVVLGEGVYVGTNASIMPDVVVGPWSTVGANSSVIHDVPSGATVVGVPAQVLMPGRRPTPGASEARGGESTADRNKGSDIEQKPSALGRLQSAQREFMERHRRMGSSKSTGRLSESK